MGGWDVDDLLAYIRYVVCRVGGCGVENVDAPTAGVECVGEVLTTFIACKPTSVVECVEWAGGWVLISLMAC